MKQEPEDSEDEPEPQMLQDLRHCTVCKTKSYLRQGLCVNAWCSSYYMLQADAGQKLTQRGHGSAGRRWTPESWKAELKDKVESQPLTNALAVADEMKDYSEQFSELQKAKPKAKAMPKELLQPTIAAADIQAPIVIEDLETGDASMHQGGMAEPPQEEADQKAYFQAVISSS